jgi:uncharacterized protein (TIGR02118 family)
MNVGVLLTDREALMAKVIFVMCRKPGMTPEQFVEHWTGEVHMALAKKVPGLTRWVQNRVVGAPGEPICDGIGELWFESDAVMEKALKSAEFGAAVEDAKNFLDTERTGMVIVQETTAIG